MVFANNNDGNSENAVIDNDGRFFTNNTFSGGKVGKGWFVGNRNRGYSNQQRVFPFVTKMGAEIITSIYINMKDIKSVQADEMYNSRWIIFSS